MPAEPPVALAAPSKPVRTAAKRPDKDRRGAVRYDCALPISCTINLSVHGDAEEWQTKWDAQVVNLSVTGIGLVLQRRFEPRTVLRVDLKSIDGRVQQIREMQVVRVVRTDRGGWYHGGMLNDTLSKAELRQLL
jgi:hypothetical protein